jgi:hypothetical protein
MSLTTEANHRLETMKETKYIHRSHEGEYCFVDKDHGIYMYDECGMIWNLLQEVNPLAFQELKAALHIHTKWEKPTSYQLHHYFRFRPFHAKEGAKWHRVKSIKDLQPGDILAWPAKVALVMEAPIEDAGYGKHIYKVKVVDSKQSPNHDQDSRVDDDRCDVNELGARTGMGTGFVALKEEGNGYFSVEVAPKPGTRFLFEHTGAVAGRPIPPS